jgi:hypothetical protein
MGHEEIREAMEHIIGCELPVHYKSEALTREFVHHRQNFYRPFVMRSVRHEIISPDVVAVQWPETDTRPVIEPEPSALWLFLRNLQPLLAPDAFDSLMVDLPSVSVEQSSDPTIAIATVLSSQALYRLSQILVRLFPL